MSTDYSSPKLRWPLDIRYQSFENEHVLILRCPIGITAQPLVLVAGIGQILSDFNGQNTLQELANKYAMYGINLGVLDELVKLLDQNFLLESERYHLEQQRVKADYHLQTIRPAALAGLSYPATKDELERLVSGYIIHTTDTATTDKTLIGLSAPHIDYQRGGTCYGITYSQLANQQHDLYVLIGTAHQYSPHLFHLSNKDFSSPLGTLACNRNLVNKLAVSYGSIRSFADEILHKQEHSLELQIPFLQYINSQPTIVPILVGSFHEYLISGKEPTEFAEYDEFAAILAECINEQLLTNRNIAIIAGVDMAHVGQFFGDKQRLSSSFMERIAIRDQEYLNCLKNGNKSALFEHIASDQDARRICGYPSMYLMLDVLERLNMPYHAIIHDYQQAVDYKTDCAVTFAGVGFYLN